ncbi:MAG: PrgI family protein [Candidatus Moraniibacteriota bacterium]
MIFNVPQFVDVEDKIAGPLTGKQLLWMIGMGTTILVAKFIIGDGIAIYLVSIPIIIIFCLLAFYRPNGQPLLLFVIYGFFFLFNPKVMMWRRPLGKPVQKTLPKKIDTGSVAPERRITEAEIRRIAEAVDRK